MSWPWKKEGHYYVEMPQWTQATMLDGELSTVVSSFSHAGDMLILTIRSLGFRPDKSGVMVQVRDGTHQEFFKTYAAIPQGPKERWQFAGNGANGVITDPASRTPD